MTLMRFAEFARRKAEAFTGALLDGPFFQSRETSDLPSINLVFVQSREGNTIADDPSALGGGIQRKSFLPPAARSRWMTD